MLAHLASTYMVFLLAQLISTCLPNYPHYLLYCSLSCSACSSRILMFSSWGVPNARHEFRLIVSPNLCHMYFRDMLASAFVFNEAFCATFHVLFFCVRST